MAFSKEITVFTRILLAFGVTERHIENGAAHPDIVVHWSDPLQSKDFHLNLCFLLQLSFYGQIFSWLFARCPLLICY